MLTGSILQIVFAKRLIGTSRTVYLQSVLAMRWRASVLGGERD